MERVAKGRVVVKVAEKAAGKAAGSRREISRRS